MPLFFDNYVDSDDSEDDAIIVKFAGDSSSIPDIVRDVIFDKNWIEHDPEKHNSNDWNLMWKNGRFKTSDFKNIHPWQRLNHQPSAATTSVTCKDGLHREMKILQSSYGKYIVDFVPTAFLMPREERQFKQDFHTKKEKKLPNHWIFKPTDKSRGRGIFVFNIADELRYSEKSIVQEYITNPLLIGGYKFDLRIYAVVACFRPLIVYLCKEGLVRFGTEKYDLSNLCNVFSHLTNTSINKTGPGYEESKVGVGSGCKWSLSALRNYFYSQGIDDRQIFSQIINIVVLTLVAQSKGVTNIISNCYELYGFDIIVDTNYKCWLLEVNYSPALAIDCSTDDDVKRNMLNSLFDMLCFTDADKLRNKKQEKRKAYGDDSSDSGISSSYSISKKQRSSSVLSRNLSRAESIRRSESRSSILESIGEYSWEADKTAHFFDSQDNLYQDSQVRRPQTSVHKKARVPTSTKTSKLPEIFNHRQSKDSDIDMSTLYPMDADNSEIPIKTDDLTSTEQQEEKVDSMIKKTATPVRINKAALLRSKQAQTKLQQIVPVFKPKDLTMMKSHQISPKVNSFNHSSKEVIKPPNDMTEKPPLSEKRQPKRPNSVYQSNRSAMLRLTASRNENNTSRNDDNYMYDDDMALNTGQSKRREQQNNWQVNKSLYGDYPINKHWKEPPKQFGSFYLVFPFNKATQSACKDTRTSDRIIMRELQKLKQNDSNNDWSVDEVWPPIRSIFS